MRTESISLRIASALLLVFMSCYLLFGCTLEAEGASITYRSSVRSRVAAIIDEQMESVIPILEENGELPDDFRASELTGEYIVSRIVEEESGDDYLDFAYKLSNTGDDYDELLEAAELLLPEDEMTELINYVEKTEAEARAIYDLYARDMTTAQRKEFYSSLKAMVVKAVVLLTAAIVYACIPSVVVWGKVSAACAVSVAAGILASGIMTFFECREYDTDFPDFDDWIIEVYNDSYASWALASSVIATGTATSRSPVVTGLVVAVFAMYNVLVDYKKLSAKYDISW